MFQQYTAELHLQMYGIALSAHLRRRCFSYGKTTGRLIAVMLLGDRPRRSFYVDPLRGAPPLRMPRNFRSLIQWHSLRRGGYQPPAKVTNLWAEPIWPCSVPLSNDTVSQFAEWC